MYFPQENTQPNLKGGEVLPLKKLDTKTDALIDPMA